MGWQISSDVLQIVREDSLHFLLDGFIPGMDVRKHLFAAGRLICVKCGPDHGVEWLAQMIHGVIDGDLQAKIV